MNWHLVGVAAFDVWAAGSLIAVVFVVLGYVLFHEDDGYSLSTGYVVRGLLLAATWPVFLLQYATSAREKAT